MHWSVCAPATNSRPTARSDSTASRPGVLKGVAVALLHDGFAIGRAQFRDDLPAVAFPLGRCGSVCWTPRQRGSPRAAPVRRGGRRSAIGPSVALMGFGDDADLQVDDQQSAVRSVLQCRHGRPGFRRIHLSGKSPCSSTSDRDARGGPGSRLDPGRRRGHPRQAIHRHPAGAPRGDLTTRLRAGDRARHDWVQGLPDAVRSAPN